MKIATTNNQPHQKLSVLYTEVRTNLANSPPDSTVLEFIKQTLSYLSTPGEIRSSKEIEFWMEKSNKLWREFSKRNVNFYERNYSIISRLQNRLHAASVYHQRLESIRREYAKKSAKKLFTWGAQPRALDPDKLAEKIKRELAVLTEDLKLVRTAFAQYTQDCKNNNKNPNDPLARIAYALESAEKACTLEEASIHQFNWARHIRKIAESYQAPSGYEFTPSTYLRELEEAMRPAEKIFFRIKDLLSAYYRAIRPPRNLDKKILSKQNKVHRPDKTSPQVEQRIKNDQRRLQAIFTTHATELKGVVCKTIAPPEAAQYFNDDLSSSWLLERDDPPRATEQLCEYKAASTGASKISGKPAPAQRHDDLTTDLAGAVVVASFGGMGGLGD